MDQTEGEVMKRTQHRKEQSKIGNHGRSNVPAQRPAGTENLLNLPADMQYLMHSEIGGVLNHGLALLYKVQPNHPIDFFAKWLIKYCATQCSKEEYDKAEQYRAHLKQKHSEELRELKRIEREKETVTFNENQEENAFKDQIIHHEYHNEILTSSFPNFLQKKKNLTGLYIGIYDHPIREINDEDEDEYAHVDKDKSRLIYYVGANDTHKFMLEKSLAPETGVTYEVFKDKEPLLDSDGNPLPDNRPSYFYVPDVTQEPRINYFLIPKLGAYIAVPLVYKSFLSDKSFDEGLKERQRYMIDFEKQSKEKLEKEQEFKQRFEEAKDEEDKERIKQEYHDMVWDDISEKPYENETKLYVVAGDTLGQDKEINEADRVYIEDMVKLFAKSWEESEKKLLDNDITFHIQMTNMFNWKEIQIQDENRINDQIDERIKEMDNITEADKPVKKAIMRVDLLKELFLSENVRDRFLLLKNYRVLKFRQILQNVLYFLGYTKDHINIKGTNLLNWKDVKNMLHDDFFRKIENYKWRGPKPAKIPPYAYLNRILKRFDKYSQEDVDEYNYGLGCLFRYAKAALEMRIQDIIQRRVEKEHLKNKRQDLIDQMEEAQKQKPIELENARTNAGDDFNEEEWLIKWDHEHQYNIPPSVEYDLDNDVDLQEILPKE